MQAEHFRGNGFIISPMNSPSVHNNRRRSFSPPKFDTTFVLRPFERLISYAQMWWHGLLKEAKVFLSKSLSVAVVLSCVMVFFQYFTFGTAIYHNGKRVAITTDTKSFYEAISMAKEYALRYSVGTLEISYNTVPALALKNNISSGEKLRDSLLLCSPSFKNACTLVAGETEIFTAPSVAVAQEIAEDFLLKYSMNGKASFSDEIIYKETVVPTEKILSREECEEKITSCDSISVVAVVNSSTQQEIPYEVKTEQDGNLYIGESVTITEGKVGSAKINYEKTYKNGNEETYRVLEENIVTSPVAAVVRVGTKPKEILKTGVLYPLEGVLSSPFGARWGKNHEGIDIAVEEGTPVLAAECGKVCYVNENSSGYGKIVKIDHGYGVTTAYAHLNEIKAYVGQSVNANTCIALSGNTGKSTGPHLHFEILKDGVPLNPLNYLKKR